MTPMSPGGAGGGGWAPPGTRSFDGRGLVQRAGHGILVGGFAHAQKTRLQGEPTRPRQPRPPRSPLKGRTATLSPKGRGQGEGATANHLTFPHPNPLPGGERERATR